MKRYITSNVDGPDITCIVGVVVESVLNEIRGRNCHVTLVTDDIDTSACVYIDVAWRQDINALGLVVGDHVGGERRGVELIYSGRDRRLGGDRGNELGDRVAVYGGHASQTLCLYGDCTEVRRLYVASKKICCLYVTSEKGRRKELSEGGDGA